VACNPAERRRANIPHKTPIKPEDTGNQKGNKPNPRFLLPALPRMLSC
jgi:hypothetical protein